MRGSLSRMNKVLKPHIFTKALTKIPFFYLLFFLPTLFSKMVSGQREIEVKFRGWDGPGCRYIHTCLLHPPWAAANVCLGPAPERTVGRLRLTGPWKLFMLSLSGEPLSNEKHRTSGFTLAEYCWPVSHFSTWGGLLNEQSA